MKFPGPLVRGTLVKRYKRFLSDIVLDDGNRQRRVHLNRSYYGLYIPPMTWREMDNFSSGSVCMVLASDYYEESDYFRDYEEFKAAVHQQDAGSRQ